ncbi:MAG: YkgJ family cysteine cluster protein [Plesiomonas sp.]
MRKVAPDTEVINVMTTEERKAKVNAALRGLTHNDLEPELSEFTALCEQGQGYVQDIVRKSYALVDKLTSYYTPLLECQKGCAHCCKVAVLANAAEVVYIEKETGIKPATKRPKRMKKAGTTKGTDYCPFLDRETACCSIYEYRPLVCRTFATIDHYTECVNPKHGHDLVTVESHPVFLHIVDLLVKMSVSIHKNHGYTEFSEIRDWFGKAPIKRPDHQQ